MGLLDNLRATWNRWDAAVTLRALGPDALTPTQRWRSDEDYSTPAAGRKVTFETAMLLPVMQRAFALMAGDIGPLPIDAYRRVGGKRIPMDAPAWVEVPDPLNPNWRRPQFIGQCVTSLMDEGNLFIRAYPDRFSTTFIRILDPYRVTIDTDADGVDFYRIGNSTRLSSAEVVHVPGLIVPPGKSRAKSPRDMLKEAISTGLAASEFGGRFFSNGSTMGGIVEVPAGTTVDAAELKKNMERGHRGTANSHALGVLIGGTFKEIGTSPSDSQMLELLEFIVEEVGRAYGIPPFKLGSTQPGAVAYASTSNARIEYVQAAVQPIVTRIEEALSTLVPGDDTFLRFNMNALLRGDQAARYTAYSTLLQPGVITKDEVRAWEDWGPADEAVGVGTDHGGFLETPNNTSPVPTLAPTARSEEVDVMVRGLSPEPVVIHNHLPDVSVGPTNVNVRSMPLATASDVEAAQRRLDRHRALRARLAALQEVAA